MDWKRLWMRRLTPITKRGEGYETLIERYQRFSDTFLKSDDEVNVKYKERLLGPELIAGVPEEYSTMQVIEKIGYSNWMKMSISEKAKWIAYYELNGISELLREHVRIQKQDTEERQRKANKPRK